MRRQLSDRRVHATRTAAGGAEVEGEGPPQDMPKPPEPPPQAIALIVKTSHA